MSVFTWSSVSTPSTGTDEVQALLNLPGTPIWIGVGDNGLILRSTDDGLTWVLSRTSETNNWRDIDYDGAKLCIVASNGTHRVATSVTQGSTWTLQTAAEANSWQAVRWAKALSLWVSVANSGTHRVQTSPDAVTWTFRTAASATTWSALAVNPASGLLCAVDTNAATMTSPDGITWTGHTLSTNHTITGGGNNRGLWSTVLAAFVVPTIDNVSKRYISYSTDGATWTDALINSFGFGQVVSAPSAGGFIAPNGPALSSVGFSRDGVQTWTIEDSGQSTGAPTWYTGNWNDGTRTVLFWDNGLNFQFLRGVLPRTLTLVTPASGAVTGAQAVTLTGLGFSGATSVTFDGLPATSVVVVNDTTITAVTPAHPSGLVPVVITGPGWTITGTGFYTYSLAQAKLPPIPVYIPVTVTGSPADTIARQWTDWLTAVKQRIEAAPVVSAEQIGVGAALTVGTDPNLKLTLSGSPTVALLKAVTITPGFIGHLPVSRGGTGLGTVATGDLLYGSAAVTLSALAIGTTGQVLEVVAGLPAWVSPAALTRVNDTNVTVTLGGTPATALLQAVSLTLGWTGQLGLSRGGSAADLSGTGGAGQYVKQATLGGAFTVGTIPASDIVSGAALTAVNDTNVTLTTGGTPATALLVAASITAGWSGTLGLSRGGTNANLSVTGGASQVLRQSSAGAAVTVSQLSVSDISGNPISGTLTTNKLPKAASATTLTDSVVQENASQIGISGAFTSDWASTAPSIQVQGGASFSTASLASSRTDGDQTRVASLAFENLTNTATFRTQALIEAFSNGPTANKRGGALLFYTQPDNTAGPVERMRIINTGSVGINTSTPDTSDWGTGGHILQVHGGTSFSTLSLASARTDGVSTRIASLVFENLTNNATFRTQAVIESLTPAAGTANKRGGDLLFYTQPDNTAGPSERMRIFSTGGVSIGNTTDPGVGNLRVGSRPVILTFASGGVCFGGTTDPGGGNVNVNNELDATKIVATTFSANVLQIGGARAISNTAPSITAHTGGTGPTISGTDNSFAVVMNNATSVTVTFGTAFLNAPNPGVSYSVAGLANQGIAMTNSTCIITGAGVAATVFVTLIGN